MTVLFVLLSLMSSCRAFATWGPQLPGRSLPNLLAIGDDECVKTADVLSLDSIRSTLIRQEETIIFALIERAQFRENSIVYEKGGFGHLGCPLGSKPSTNDEPVSFLEYMLMGTVRTRVPPTLKAGNTLSSFSRQLIFSPMIGSFALWDETLYIT